MTTELIGAVYARTSHEKDDAFSISSQVKLCTEGAGAIGVHIPEEFVFREDFTGTVIDRPELNKVRRLMAGKRIQVLIIYDIDRLARKKYISEYLLEEEIFRNDIQLYVARKGMFVRNTLSDRILFGIEGNSAQEERDKVLERTARGRRQKLEGSDETPGAWLGQGAVDLFGYEKVGKKRNTRLVILEKEAEVVRLIFNLYVNERWGVSQIVRHLDAQGIPTPSQSKGNMQWNTRSTWHHAMLYRILKQVAYTGVFYGFKTIEVNGKTKRRPKEEWVRLDFPELKLVEQDMFDTAQELLKHGRSANAPKWKAEYLMVRRLRCQCSYAVQARASVKQDRYGQRTYCYYVCYGKLEHVAEDCPVPNIRADVVDQKVWESIENLLRDPERQLRALQRAQELQRDQHHEALEKRQDLEERRRQLVQELDELYQDYREKIIRREVYIKRKQPIEDRLSSVEAVLTEYEQKLSQEVLSDKEVIEISDNLRKLHRLLEELGTLEYEHKRNIVELMRLTGEFSIEGGEHILTLRLYEWNFDRIVLGVVPQISCSLYNFPQHSSAHIKALQAIELRISLGSVPVTR